MATTKINKYEEVIDNSKTMQLMHRPQKEGNNVLYSIHQRGKHKTLWYMSSWELMDAQNSPTNPEMVTYKSKIFPYNSLVRSVMTTKTPSIRVNDGYQIRFCQDLFINMVREFRLYLNDIELQYGNNKSLDFDLKNHKNWSVISEELGNKKGLTTWSEELKSQDIALYLPWFYSKDKSDSFPLKYCGSNDRLHHMIEFNLQLSNLILIRDSEGNIIDYDPQLLTVSNNMESIPIPETEGLYTMLTNKEVNIAEGSADEVDGEKEIYTCSSYYVEDENEVPLGKKVQLKIDSKSKQPVTSVYWGALNKTKTEEEKSNIYYYQDNCQNNPVKYTKIETSIGTILDNKSSYKTQKAYNLYSEVGLVNYEGMNYWTNNVLLSNDCRKFLPGIVLSGGQFTITLKEKNNNEDKYVVFAILNNVRRFKFKNYPKTQQDRLKFGCTIEPDEDD